MNERQSLVQIWTEAARRSLRSSGCPPLAAGALDVPCRHAACRTIHSCGIVGSQKETAQHAGAPRAQASAQATAVKAQRTPSTHQRPSAPSHGQDHFRDSIRSRLRGCCDLVLPSELWRPERQRISKRCAVPSHRSARRHAFHHCQLLSHLLARDGVLRPSHQAGQLAIIRAHTISHATARMSASRRGAVSRAVSCHPSVDTEPKRRRVWPRCICRSSVATD